MTKVTQGVCILCCGLVLVLCCMSCKGISTTRQFSQSEKRNTLILLEVEIATLQSAIASTEREMEFLQSTFSNNWSAAWQQELTKCEETYDMDHRIVDKRTILAILTREKNVQKAKVDVLRKYAISGPR